MKGVAPVGFHGGLNDDRGPPAEERVDAEKKPRIRGALHADLPFSEIHGLVGMKEVSILPFPGSGGKGHAEALMHAITVPKP